MSEFPKFQQLNDRKTANKLKKFRRKYRNLHIAVAKFSEFRGKYAYFWRHQNFLTTQCRMGGRKLSCQNSARSIYFSRTPTCDKQTRTDTGP